MGGKLYVLRTFNFWLSITQVGAICGWLGSICVGWCAWGWEGRNRKRFLAALGFCVLVVLGCSNPTIPKAGSWGFLSCVCGGWFGWFGVVLVIRVKNQEWGRDELYVLRTFNIRTFESEVIGGMKKPPTALRGAKWAASFQPVETSIIFENSTEDRIPGRSVSDHFMVNVGNRLTGRGLDPDFRATPCSRDLSHV